MQKQTTAMQKLIDYLRANFHLAEDTELEFIASLEAEKEQLINFHIETMKLGLINEGEKIWKDGYEPKIIEAAQKCFEKTFDNSVVS